MYYFYNVLYYIIAIPFYIPAWIVEFARRGCVWALNKSEQARFNKYR